ERVSVHHHLRNTAHSVQVNMRTLSSLEIRKGKSDDPRKTGHPHNTVKHARTSQMELELDQTDEVLMLQISDNGRGFDRTASFPGHLGLHSMQERVKSLGGEREIESAPGQ